MADYAYAFNGNEEGTAKAMLRDSPISTKVAIEMANYLRGRSTKKAKTILELVLKKQHAIPFKRFTDGVGHKKGNLAAGRYPQKASEQFLELIKAAENNASQNNMSEDLIILHLAAHQASRPFHYGRQRRRQMKRTHVEMVVVEDPKKRSERSARSSAKKATTKKPAEKTPVEKSAKESVKPKTEAKPVPAKTSEKKKVEATPAVKEAPKNEVKAQVKPVEEEAKQKPAEPVVDNTAKSSIQSPEKKEAAQ